MTDWQIRSFPPPSSFTGMVHCLVCGKKTPVTHMGLDVCRACAVFYKRNKPLEATLACVEGDRACTDFQKGNYSCRQCRLDRFNDVMKTCSKGNELAVVPSCSSVEVPPNDPIPSHLEDMSIVDRVRRYYIKLSSIRRNNELAFRGVELDPYKANKEDYEVMPCTYQVMNQAVRIMVSTLFDFANALFPEFKGFAVEDKWMLVRNFQTTFHCLESHMRSQRFFPTDSGKCFGTYTTYLAIEASRTYFSDCLNQEHADEASRTLQFCIRENCYRVRDHLDRVKPTDDEFMAMMGIAFWSIENTDASDDLLNLATRYRTLILSKMMARYKETAGGMEGTVRIGQLYGILGTIKRVEMNLKWEYEVYRMLNLFDDHTYMYKLQMHKPDIICKSIGKNNSTC
ncbi:hypothetical protein PFISCL1PPCAC_14432 [Pristionchus fissidentatus]|uniref:Nuclear receptor n=1 Tax=Pristionchus fissidentatus TaxID=1538716 RepID=A0AAV5VUE2_9BILA|nr:hypothetical protein PFISCL1PPCAC_14432 [Pristionchus fissidentatus]